MLGACGTDVAADGPDPVPAHGVIQGYPFDAATSQLRRDETYIFRTNKIYGIDTEWGTEYSWWARPHDLVPVPNQSKFLMSNDIGLFEFDIERGEFPVS